MDSLEMKLIDLLQGLQVRLKDFFPAKRWNSSQDPGASVSCRPYENMWNNLETNKQENLKCDFCSNTYKTLSKKLEHERTHTGERPFKCHLCDYGATQKSNLKRHLRFIHPEIFPLNV